MEFIEYSKCSTCRAAKRYLDEHNILYKDRSILDETPSFQEIKNWIKRFDLDVNDLFNLNGLKYRKLQLKEKLNMMSEEEKIKLLASDGKLIKRPILFFDDGDEQNFLFSEGFLYGFHEEEWDLFFSKLK